MLARDVLRRLNERLGAIFRSRAPAAADGTLHPRELALLRSLHAALGLTRTGQPA